MIRRITGKPNIEWMPKAASVAINAHGLVYANGSGYLIQADATSGDHFGVSLRAVASTDADYALTTKIPVDVPAPSDIFEMDVETGTFTVAMVGNAYDLVADGDALDVSAQAKKVVTIVGYVSATKALVKINAMAVYKDVATT